MQAPEHYRERFLMDLAKFHIRQFELAGHCRIDPNKVGRFLNGTTSMTPEVASRMEAAINTIVQNRVGVGQT